MIPASTQVSSPAADRVDQRVCLHGIAWKDYEQLLAADPATTAWGVPVTASYGLTTRIGP